MCTLTKPLWLTKRLLVIGIGVTRPFTRQQAPGQVAHLDCSTPHSAAKEYISPCITRSI